MNVDELSHEAIVSRADSYTLYCPAMAPGPEDPGVFSMTSLGEVINALFSHVSEMLRENEAFDGDVQRTVGEKAEVIESYFQEVGEADPSDCFVVKVHIKGDRNSGFRLDSLVKYAHLPEEDLYKARRVEGRQQDLAEAFEELGRLRRENERLRGSALARSNWLREAKEKLGYSSNVSFDVVFEDLVAKARKYDEMTGGDD